MAKRMLIDATHPEETRVAVVDGRRLEEFDVEVASKKLLKGNIYLAKITRVEPSLQAAFVEYGGNRHGFLAFSEIHPDYYRIPVEDREALLAEQAAMAREEDEREEEESQSRHRRSDSRRRGRSDRSGSRGGTTSPEAANEDPAADSLAGPQDEMSSHGSDHDSGHDDSGHDDLAITTLAMMSQVARTSQRSGRVKTTGAQKRLPRPRRRPGARALPCGSPARPRTASAASPSRRPTRTPTPLTPRRIRPRQASRQRPRRMAIAR